MKVQNISQEDSAKLFASISLLVDSNVLICKKKSRCFQNDKILDFSKEHQFKINKDLLEKYKIRIQIKKTTTIVIGPTEKDTASQHFKKMLENPNEWNFMWHDLHSESVKKNP